MDTTRLNPAADGSQGPYSAMYERLRQFLRVVPVHRSRVYGHWYFLQPTAGPELFKAMVRDKREFRIFYRPGTGFCAVIWMPNDESLRMPTLMEFYQAYDE